MNIHIKKQKHTKIIVYIIFFIIFITIIISIVLGILSKGTECDNNEYLDDRTCKPCNTFDNDDGIITNSCTRCTGPNPEDCKHATCVNGYYAVYNEFNVQCDPCITQDGCIESNQTQCYNIKGIENTYKCNIGKNDDGFYINNEGISNLCEEGTFSYAREGTTSGCQECVIQEGCKSGEEYISCTNIEGYENKLRCELTGNEKNYYIDINGISHRCEVGTYNDENTLNTIGCFPCVPQDECSSSGSSNECLTINGFEDKLFCNDTKEEIQLNYPNKTIFNGLIKNIECITPNTTGYQIINNDGSQITYKVELNSNLELDINVECDNGYGSEIGPQLTACTEHNRQYTLSGCEECTTQRGCSDHKELCSLIPATCSGTATDTVATPNCAYSFNETGNTLRESCPEGCTYNSYKTKLECKPGASNNGFYIDYDGIVNECEVGTYSLAGEASESGCEDCIQQEGCRIHNDYCLNINGSDDNGVLFKKKKELYRK